MQQLIAVPDESGLAGVMNRHLLQSMPQWSIYKVYSDILRAEYEHSTIIGFQPEMSALHEPIDSLKACCYVYVGTVIK